VNRDKNAIDWNLLPRRSRPLGSHGARDDSPRSEHHSDIPGIPRPRGSVSNFDQHPENPVLDLKSGDSEVPDTSTRPIDDDASLVRCVMLISPDEHPPQQLLNLLKQPASTVDRAEHPLLAVARLSTLERSRAMRAEWSPDTDERTVLVVVNRDVWRDLSPLFQTIRQIMPRVSIWVCTERVAIEVHAGQHDESAPETTAEHLDPTESYEPDDATAPSTPLESPEVTTLSDEEMRDLLDLFEGTDDDDPDAPPAFGLSGGPRTS
jgi:hypothetical protein